MYTADMYMFVYMFKFLSMSMSVQEDEHEHVMYMEWDYQAAAKFAGLEFAVCSVLQAVSPASGGIYLQDLPLILLPPLSNC
jgi:hypothetical protein